MTRYTAAALLFALVACKPAGSTQTDGKPYRTNTREVWAGLQSQSGCGQFDPEICTMYQNLWLDDMVARDNEIYAVGMGPNSAAYLFASTDGGQTWKSHGLAGGILNTTGFTSEHSFIRLAYGGDKLRAIVSASEEGALGLSWTHCWAYEVDRTTLDLTGDGVKIDCPTSWPTATWGKLHTLYYSVDPRSPPPLAPGGFTYRAWDVATMTKVDEKGWFCETADCMQSDANFTGTSAMFGWYSWFVATDGSKQVCLNTYVGGNTGVSKVCSSAEPLLSHNNGAETFIGGRLWKAQWDANHAWLAAIKANVPDNQLSFDLGAVTVDRAIANVFMLTNADGSTRLVTARGDQPVDVKIPTTPCANEADCRRGGNAIAGIAGIEARVQLLAPAEGGTYHVFYLAKEIDSGGRTQFRLLYSRESDAGIVHGDTATTALEKMCARVGACFPDNYDNTIPTCVGRWMQLTGASADADPMFQAFLGTPAGCDSFLATDPRGAAPAYGSTCTPDQSQCLGASAWICPEGGSRYGMNCLYWGVGCEMGPNGPRCEAPTTCTDPTQVAHCEGDFVVDCSQNSLRDCAAQGLVCKTSGGYGTCALDLSCQAKGCLGSVAYECYSSGTAAPQQDCSVLGMECRDGQCVLSTLPDSCNYGQETCDGTKLNYCLILETPDGQVSRKRTLDCAELGLKCITQDPTDSVMPKARCAMP